MLGPKNTCILACFIMGMNVRNNSGLKQLLTDYTSVAGCDRVYIASTWHAVNILNEQLCKTDFFTEEHVFLMYA